MVDRSLLPSAETSAERIAFLRSLRAVRRFAAEPVPDDVVTNILEVGRWTGSAKNTQPWEMLVVRDHALLRDLATLGQFAGHLAGADFAIVLIMNSVANRLDAGRLAENVMHAAWAYGVGSCIGSLAPDENEARAKELLGIPPERDARTAISFGYPADEAATRISSTPGTRSVLPSIGRKPLAELVHINHYGNH